MRLCHQDGKQKLNSHISLSATRKLKFLLCLIIIELKTPYILKYLHISYRWSENKTEFFMRRLINSRTEWYGRREAT